MKPHNKEIPFSFYTSTPRIANLFPLDLFNVLPKIQSMRQNHIAMSKIDVDVNNVEQMGEVLQKQTELKFLETEILNLLEIAKGLKNSPTFNIYLEYAMGCSVARNPPNDKITLDSQIQKVCNCVQGERQVREPDVLKRMFRLACQCVVCAAVIDHIISLDQVPEGKKTHKRSQLNYKKYINHLVDMFPDDDIEVREYGKKALSAVERLIQVPQIDWAKIHEQALGA